MIPLRDSNPTRRFPVITVLIIAVNLIVYAADQLTGTARLVQVVSPDGLGYVRQFTGGLSDHYAMVPVDVTANAIAAWPTVFTSMFLHANLLHVGGNMLYLWVFGNNVEDTLGRLWFIAFYLLAGAIAAAVHIALAPGSDIPTVGASGAVAGVMGAYMVLYPRARVLALVPIFVIGMLMEVPATLVIGLWAVVQFVNVTWLGGGEMLHGGGVAYGAHVGGFVAGVIIIMALGGRSLLASSLRRGKYSEW